MTFNTVSTSFAIPTRIWPAFAAFAQKQAVNSRPSTESRFSIGCDRVFALFATCAAVIWFFAVPFGRVLAAIVTVPALELYHRSAVYRPLE